ncbi:DEAD/DEAH box helicase [Brevibacillus laterosporus]|nr:DEAD/DEAH box helicase family protein [Brevibacillus laterosporus]TPG71149.1 DEAD/DEAH box helicase [Brevibacillus laterosporus]
MRDEIIKQMMSYPDPDHKRHLHKQAFTDIANVFLDLLDEYRNQYDKWKKTKEKTEKVKWVCDASMGHGKTSVLISFLKWLVNEKEIKKRVPVLIVIRETKMAEEIFNELKKFDENCIVMVEKENKANIEKYVPYHQIVIITHSRLDNLSLGYGNPQTYRIWEQYHDDGWSIYKKLDEKNFISKKYRVLIVDEKPSFVNSTVFDIGKENNTLKWFDDLASTLKLNPYETQAARSRIITLIADELAENLGSVTNALISEGDKSTKGIKQLINLIKIMKNTEDNFHKIESLKQLKHFEKLILQDGTGRIDNYDIRGYTGRKIIVSELISYSKLGMNILVLDGTARLTFQQYEGYSPKQVKNYTNYSRLHFHVETINTSKPRRDKKNNPIQKAISKRIFNLKKDFKDLFVLPMKSDIAIYEGLGAISEEDNGYFRDGINLLNTSGKNELRKRKSLYLTSLPKMNPDHYKQIAIAIYGNEIQLDTNEETDNGEWFKDGKLEWIYRGELYSEILQIIHRTALRSIESKEEIHVFIAYDDEDISKLKHNGQSRTSISESINHSYFKKQANIHEYTVPDETLYNRGDKIRDFAERFHRWINKNITTYNQLPKKLSEIDKENGLGEEFRKWLSKKQNWKKKREMIDTIFAENGYKIYEKGEGGTKYITTVDEYSNPFKEVI